VAGAGTARPQRAPALIERFIKQLNITSKALRLYPSSSAIPQENAEVAIQILGQLLQRESAILLAVTRDGFVYAGVSVFPSAGPFAVFAREFYARGVSEVRFHAGCTATEVIEFLSLMLVPQAEIVAAGGLGPLLWERQVLQISIVEASAAIVDIGAAGGSEAAPAAADDLDAEDWPPTRERLDEIVEGAQAGRPRDRRLLVRAVSHDAILRTYLRESATARGIAPTDAEIAGRVGALAHSIQFELPEEREALLRSLAEAVLDLGPEMRAKLLTQRLLSEARRDDSVAQIIKQMSLDEVLDAILNEIPGTPEARSGLVRAVRNIALISGASSRGEVLEAAGRAMVAHGMSPGDARETVAAALPARLESKGPERASGSDPVESVLRLLDLTPGGPATYAYDEGLATLRAEAGRGLTDGDVLAALVTIATLETRPAEFGAVMHLLDQSLGLLIDEQEFEVAADAAEALTVAAADPTIGADRRKRMGELLRVLARPEAMRSITAAMRVHRHDSEEHAACRRLLAVLGTQTIAPLLEVLAQEQDMTARKSMVELISSLAKENIGELGLRVADQRWYFVRNVVAILGATRDQRALPFLERTLRHSDARVRRETIRSAAGIRDARSDVMLVAALADEDAANVQLAARYLGLLKMRGALPSLEQVARGEGRGNRENGPRIEAIESLGRIGSPTSVTILEDLARQRGLLAGRTRDIRTAAAAALAIVRAKEGSS
jgi:HEAT repeat protein